MSADRSPLPDEQLTQAALHYHLALRWLVCGHGKIAHLVLLAQHLLISRSLIKIGCSAIPEETLLAADEAIVKWTRHGLLTDAFQIDTCGFQAIHRFLLAHDGQLKAASSAAVAVALADLREARAVNRVPPGVVPYATIS